MARKKNNKRDNDFIIGRLSVNARGFGFVTPENEGTAKSNDIFIPANKMTSALHGDKVKIKISYSWGDEESPYKSFDSKEDAYKKACELACNEAYEYNSEFDADRRCEVLFDAASLSISLHYLGDDSWCYYNIETVSITHHLT